MSRIIAVVGDSGTGKSTSIRNLDPKSTVILAPIGKDLPFKSKGFGKNNKNYFTDLDGMTIGKYLHAISEKKPEVKVVIVDDFQYVMAKQFMARASEKSYEKFTEIGKEAYEIIRLANSLRDDLTVIFLSHQENDEFGRSKIKTIGKMLDDKVVLEGLFTIVLFTKVKDGKYFFQTNTDGVTTAKSPMGMLDPLEDNDLKLILEKIEKYYE